MAETKCTTIRTNNRKQIYITTILTNTQGLGRDVHYDTGSYYRYPKKRQSV